MANILLSPSGAGSELAKELEHLNLRVIIWPAPNVSELETYVEIDEAIENLFGYDWLILKNPNATRSFLGRCQLQHQMSDLDELRVLTIGEAAREELLDSSIHIDLALERFSPDGVFEALAAYAGNIDALGRLNFLIPSANIATESFEENLSLAGARVDNLKAYATTNDYHQLIQVRTLLLGGGIDAVVFNSPANINDFAQLVDSDDLSRLLRSLTVVCTDRETLELAVRFGLAGATGCFEPTGDGLAALITTA
jgi:uroporphyrinogen-III synthase